MRKVKRSRSLRATPLAALIFRLPGGRGPGGELPRKRRMRKKRQRTRRDGSVPASGAPSRRRGNGAGVSWDGNPLAACAFSL